MFLPNAVTARRGRAPANGRPENGQLTLSVARPVHSDECEPTFGFASSATRASNTGKAADGIRTRDLVLTKDALYRLSYSSDLNRTCDIPAPNANEPQASTGFAADTQARSLALATRERALQSDATRGLRRAFAHRPRNLANPRTNRYLRELRRHPQSEPGKYKHPHNAVKPKTPLRGEGCGISVRQ